MNIQFEILFTVGISHDYYSDGCKDFDFFIPSDTARLLRNGKLVARVREGTLYVLFEANEALATLGGKTLRFGLKLLNPFFSHITALTSNSFIPVYKNSASSGQLNSTGETILAGRLFSHDLANAERPVTVTLKASNGEIMQADAIAETDGRSATVYDLSDADPGFYTVDEAYSPSTVTTSYYVDSESQAEGVFGIVEVDIHDEFYSDPPDFEIEFAAREEILKYYVVAKNYSETDINQLSIQDAGFTEDQRSEIRFTKVASDAFGSGDIDADLLADENVEVVMFKSQAVVARREKARKKIQLSKNGEVIIPHLPQPGANRVNADLIIQLSKP